MPNLPTNSCLELVRRSIPDLTAREMEEIIDDLRGREGALIAQGLSPVQAAKRATKELSDTLKIAAKIERRNAAINRNIRLKFLDYVHTVWADDPMEGILSKLYGSPKSRVGSRDSVNAAQSANFRRYIAGIEKELQDAGLMDVLRRGEMDRQIAKALWSINDERILASIPSSATVIARILNKYRETARLESNRAGAWIGGLDRYIVRQTHDADRLRKAGYDAWRGDILPKLDVERMFPGGIPANLEGWLKEAYDNLVSGVRPRNSAEIRAERMAAFRGPGNLAKRLSQDRVFHFKSADDWFDYNTKYGHGNLRETYINDLHRRSETLGLIQVLGTNPEYNLDAVVKALKIQLSRSDPKRAKDIDETRIRNAYREISGFTRTIASESLANIGALVRAWAVVTTLGRAVVTSITDVPFRASLLRYQGQNFLGAIGTGIIAPMQGVLKAYGSIEKQAALHAVGHFNDIAFRNIVSRFSPDENLPGKIHKVLHTFFKWNLLAAWTREMRRSALEAMARFHGEMAQYSWENLSERTRRSLERFNITSENWNVIRRGLQKVDEGSFLTPEAIRNLPLDHFLELAKPRIEAIQRGLLERVQKRMKADAREHGWVEGQRKKFFGKLDRANERLIEFANKINGRVLTRQELLTGKVNREIEAVQNQAASTEQAARGKLVEAAMEANGRLAELRTKLEDITDWWRMHFDMEQAPNYGKRLIRSLGVEEGTVRAQKKEVLSALHRAQSEFRKTMEEIQGDLESLRPKKETQRAEEVDRAESDAQAAIEARYEEFNSEWKENHEELMAFSKDMDKRAADRSADTKQDLDKLGGRINKAVEDVRHEQADLVQRFYADDLDSAIITPDTRSSALVRQGQQDGTPMGVILRLFWQNKTFSIAAIQRGFLREFYGYDKGRGGRLGVSEIQGLALLILGATGFGYASLAIKDLLAGRTPRSPDKTRNWIDAMAAGGGLGLYGDFLLGQQVRYGAGFLQSVAGPTFGKADDLTQIYGAVLNGNDPRAQMLKFAINNLPYNNLFYTRTALDYLFLYNLMEAMNPGYLRRYEKKVTEETGSEWWMRPSEAAR